MPTWKDVVPPLRREQPRANHLDRLGDQGHVNRGPVLRIACRDRPNRSGEVHVRKPHSQDCGLPRPRQQGEPQEIGDPHVLGGVDRVEQPGQFLGGHEPFAFLLGERLYLPHGVPAGEIEIVRSHLE